MHLELFTLAERPDLMDTFWDMETSWPEFMKHDPIGNGYYASLDHFREFVLVCLDESGRMVAKAHSVPFQLPEGELPDAGWDFAIRSGLLTELWGEEPDAVTAVEIAIEPGLQGSGLSGRIVAALRDNAGRLGFSELLAPVRPNGKTDVHEPMADYAARTRDDGLPVDPWLRVHVRAGGRIDRVAPRVDGHPRHGRGVARVDRAALRHDRPRRRTRCPGAGDVRRRARHGDVRRAQRLGQAPHRGMSVMPRRPPCGPR